MVRSPTWVFVRETACTPSVPIFASAPSMVALHALEEMSEDLQASQLFFSSQAIAMSSTMATKGGFTDQGASVTRPSERSMSWWPTVR